MFPTSVKSVTIHVLSDTDILNKSVVNITSHEYTKQTSQNIKATPYDERLGPDNNTKPCKECGLKLNDCRGHFGHIVLKRPRLNYMYIQELAKFLNCFCSNCGKITLKSENFPIYRKIVSKKRLEKMIIENPVCEYCKYNKIMYTVKINTLYCKGVSKRGTDKKTKTTALPVSTDDVKTIFSILDNEDVKIILKDVFKINSIEDVDINFFILDMIPVTPIKNRPGHLSHPDDQTLLYSEILKSEEKKKYTSTIDYVEVLTDNRGKVAGLKSSIPYRSLSDKLKGKTGLFRGNCMGKRIEYSSRSVITDNPNVDVDELVIPYNVVQTVTKRVRVSGINIEYLQNKLNEYGKILTSIYTSGKYNVRGTFAQQNLSDLLCHFAPQGVPEKIICFRHPILCKKILLRIEHFNKKTQLFLNDVPKIDILEDMFMMRYFMMNGEYETKEIIDINICNKSIVCEGTFFIPTKSCIFFIKKKQEPTTIDVKEYFRPSFYINSSIREGDIPCHVISRKIPPFICVGDKDIEKCSFEEFGHIYRGNILRGNKVLSVFPEILSFSRGDFIITKEGKCVNIYEYSDYIPCETDVLLRRGGETTYEFDGKQFEGYTKYKLFLNKKREDATSNAQNLLCETLKQRCFPTMPKNWKGGNHLTQPIKIKMIRSNDVFDGILIEGDECEVQLKDGDYVMFGRQPSLHVGSMLTKKVKILKGNKDKSFQFNTTSTATYNADFDGDEMNAQVPRNELTRAEFQFLSSTQRFIKSPQSSKCLLSFKQDTATGGYMFTRENAFLEYIDFCDYLSILPDWNEKFSLFRDRKRESLRAYDIVTCMFPIPTKELGGLYYSSGDVKIINSVYKSGALTGKHYSAIISKIEKEYGYEACKYFLFNFQKIIDLYLSRRGLSVGLEEMMFVGQDLSFVDEEINEKIKTITQTKLEESEINIKLNELNNIGSKIMEGRENSLISMIRSGGKGKEQNITQLVGLVGQQNVGGKRINCDLYSGRTLTCYRTETPESRGFVRSSFTRGLNQQEVFFHAAGGREGVIDTAVKTGYSGYISRKFMKKLEDYHINYRGELRDSYNNIISFTFNDTLDPERLVKNEGKNFFVNVHDCVEKFYNLS